MSFDWLKAAQLNLDADYFGLSHQKLNIMQVQVKFFPQQIQSKEDNNETRRSRTKLQRINIQCIFSEFID